MTGSIRFKHTNFCSNRSKHKSKTLLALVTVNFFAVVLVKDDFSLFAPVAIKFPLIATVADTLPRSAKSENTKFW